MNPDFVYAPWTAEQVASLNSYQHSAISHPFTCGNDECPPSVAGLGADNLLALSDGWVCPSCGYRQLWAWKWMADGTWREYMETMKALGFKFESEGDERA